MARLDVPDGPGGEAAMIWTLRPQLGDMVERMIRGAYQQSILPPDERELARMRIAQINDCVACSDFRADSVLAAGVGVGHEDTRVICGQTERVLVARAPGCGQLWKLGPDLGEPRRVNPQWRQVRLREIAVVLGELLAALADRAAVLLAPAARLARDGLAGNSLTYADLSAAAHLSAADYLGDVPWDDDESAKNWYARIKSRPSFRVLLAETLPGLPPSPSYANLDF